MMSDGNSVYIIEPYHSVPYEKLRLVTDSYGSMYNYRAYYLLALL